MMSSRKAKQAENTQTLAADEPTASSSLFDQIDSVLRNNRNLVDARLCGGCGGWGVKTYGSTATWRGGVGGQMMTNDVCNQCWGSGNADRPWPSHRLLGA